MKYLPSIFFTFFSALALADPVQVQITSKQGTPIIQAVVFLEPTGPMDLPPPQSNAVMDQIQSQFVPHILAVQKGTQVSFPNSDSVKHHVYSFSPANTFELQLYEGSQAVSLPFGNSGEVELGCNVHDWMLGYIYVVDTPFFAKTSETGLVEIDVPEGEYRVKIWHPRIQDSPRDLVKTIQVPSQNLIQFQLKEALLSNLDAFEANQDEFDEYD